MNYSENIFAKHETVYDILETCCVVFGCERGMLFIKYRPNNLVFARMACAFILKENCNLSLTDVGFIMQRNHTTIIHTLRQCLEMYKTDTWFNLQLTTCCIRLGLSVPVVVVINGKQKLSLPYATKVETK